MHRLTHTADGPGRRGGGRALLYIRLNPTYYRSTLKNKCLFGQSQSPGVPGLICLSARALTFCSVSQLIWAGHLTRSDAFGYVSQAFGL